MEGISKQCTLPFENPQKRLPSIKRNEAFQSDEQHITGMIRHTSWAVVFDQHFKKLCCLSLMRVLSVKSKSQEEKTASQTRTVSSFEIVAN
jgi:hypothetical protein